MKICKHCGRHIGQWHKEYPEMTCWMHAPEDGPDAYQDCKCYCRDCNPGKYPLAYYPCCDGEQAEPIPPEEML